MASIDNNFTLIRQELAGMHAEVGAMRTEMRQELAGMRTEMREELAAMRGEIAVMRSEFTSFQGRLVTIGFGLLGTMATSMAALIVQLAG